MRSFRRGRFLQGAGAGRRPGGAQRRRSEPSVRLTAGSGGRPAARSSALYKFCGGPAKAAALLSGQRFLSLCRVCAPRIPTNKKDARRRLFLLVGMTGFEPATSASRTQRSTKLSHIPLRIPSLLSNGEGTGGCPTRIRTQTNRVRVCRATFTQSGNSNMNYYNGSGEKVKTYRKKTAFIFYFWRKVPLIARAVRRTIHIANAKPMKERNKPCLTRKPRTH